jgi:hypothetical protein
VLWDVSPVAFSCLCFGSALGPPNRWDRVDDASPRGFKRAPQRGDTGDYMESVEGVVYEDWAAPRSQPMDSLGCA